MDLEKIEKRLKKINSVLDVFKSDFRITQIEKDLLLGYVRELYELIKEGDEKIEEKRIQEKEKRDDEKLKNDDVTINTEKILLNVMKDSEIKNPKEDLLPKETSELEKIDKIETETKRNEPAPILIEQEPTIEPVSKKEEIKIEDIGIKKTYDINQEILDEVFETNETIDLSERLSMTKLNDIQKGIGINERFYFARELFGGNNEKMSASIEALNKFDNLTSAKNYFIENILKGLKLDQEEKMKAAQQFARIIKRRYL